MFFEAQLAAYSANATGQPIFGWYFWTCKPRLSAESGRLAHGTGKTEYDIDTWSYRRGVEDGYIPSDVSNASTLAFPVLGNGCIDAGFNYTAPPSPESPSSPWYWGAAGRLSIDSITLAMGLGAGVVHLALSA
jgi:glucan 1,3-beta-glucosidase